MAWLRRNLVVIVGVLVMAYILIPNLVVTVFSFNKPGGRYNYQWNAFSLEAWLNPCASQGMCDALALSLWVAVVAAGVSTVIGTMAAFALGRYRFRGRAATNLLIFFPMATPEVVMGSSLLTLFIAMGIPSSQLTILIAHIMFTLSFVVTTVKARVASLDPSLEQAAADLYATPAQAFWKVTFPLVAPGIGAGALLAFALSFDDYIVTNFNAGATTVTFPMYVWGASQRGAPVQVNVIGTVMFFGALAIVGLAQTVGVRMRLGSKRKAAA